jgi:hypothetical protein
LRICQKSMGQNENMSEKHGESWEYDGKTWGKLKKCSKSLN